VKVSRRNQVRAIFSAYRNGGEEPFLLTMAFDLLPFDKSKVKIRINEMNEIQK
jgi:hypothetical protein